MSAQFARILSPVPAVPSGHGGGETPSAGTGGLLAQAAAGPGFWEDLLGELRRAGLIAELLADGVITTAVAQAEHGHKLDRVLTAQVTAMCVIVGALFPDQGYDLVLARTFKMPGLPVKPGTVTPSGPALSRARALLGEQVMRRVFELDAARTDLDLGIGATWHGLQTTGMDGAGQPVSIGRSTLDRWIRFSADGAHLAWRVKNGAKSVPFKTLRVLSDGSELVLLRESASMPGKRRRDVGDKTLPRLPDTIARLVSFTVTARTARRARTTTIKVLTTLLDPGAFPAREIAALYAERWQAEIACLHLKKTIKGTGRVLRGRSVTLARQETWALLLVHNMTATLAARAAGQAGLDPDLIPFTAVLSLIRGHVAGDTCCPHCGKRPASGNGSVALLVSQILAQPAHRGQPQPAPPPTR